MRCEVSTLPPATAAGRPRVDHGACGRNELNGTHEARGGGDIVAQQAAKNVEAGGIGDGFHRVDAASYLRRAAGEIHDYRLRRGRLSREPDAHSDTHGIVADTIVVEKILGSVSTGRNGCEEGAHHLLGVIEQCGASAPHSCQAVTAAEFVQSRGAGVTGGELRAQVAPALLGSTDIVQQQRQQVAIDLAAAHDLHRRDT